MGYARWATYGWATVAGIFTNCVFGLLRCYVLLALFRAVPHAGGYSIRDAILYTWLGQGMLAVVSIWGWYEIAERVRSGDVIADLYRPMDFQLYWLAQDLGRATYHFVFRGIPPFLVGCLIFHVDPRPLAGLVLPFLVSTALAVVVSFALRFITNVAAFWLLDYRGVSTVAASLWTFLSGMAVPLVLLPQPWRGITLLLPFAGMIQTPIDIVLGLYNPSGVVRALALQAGWGALLMAAGHVMFRRAQRRLVIQGG
jgi:ABC-2 type transport system permease protein